MSRRRYRAAARDMSSGSWLALSLALAVCGLVGGGIAWLLTGDWRAVGAIGGICGGFGASLQAVVAQHMTARHTPVAPAMPTAQELEPWRAALRLHVLAARVRAGSQLDRMLAYPVISNTVRELHRDASSARIVLRGPTLSWSAIVASWAASPQRTVLLGEPGMGKTIAALTLIAEVNASASGGRPVAELFPLSRWDTWSSRHATEPLETWLASSLAERYPELGTDVAAALVASDLVLPVFDGLDEIPTTGGQLACLEAIDRYGGRVSRHRPYLLTSRAEEYVRLAPRWAVTDRPPLVLRGLAADGVLQLLATETAGQTGWRAMSRRLASGDSGAARLLSSPLRLSIALQSYAREDPQELLALSPGAADQRLWERLISSDHSFGSAGTAQVRGWLAALASGVKRCSLQRFGSHHLYALAPASTREQRHFKVLVAVLVAAIWTSMALLSGVSRHGVGTTLIFVGITSVLVAPIGWLAGIVSLDGPYVRVRARRDERTRLAKRGIGPAIGGGFLLGTISRTDASALEYLLAGTVGAIWGIVLLAAAVMLAPGLRSAAGGTHPETAASGPADDGVLRETLRTGVVRGILFAPLIGTTAYFLTTVTADDPAAITREDHLRTQIGFVAALPAFALTAALFNGLGFWLCHHWLRRRRGRDGTLPLNLGRFLTWCSESPRFWLRASDMYEFRHRALLDHLAPDHEPEPEPTRCA
ncbi:hypothetical protein VSS74_07845 [Conexibacter stalactiti]|uniref:NACHT domain-containing protein n=1 Tax=Conexibacter stalactiti TaxID=1940611 RepID=A0ABU4HLR9_9ACTN|nr:hypothetical protein [Conexibacter stalactiti]MDW5594243.1 hypothetical protein [Conexibacter stalactiti]MEC5034885.1 hypothetical protein [Conexibacter stalactiti]